MNKNLKIAIVHDYIKEYGGAERVLEELVRLFPTADIYTSLYAPEFLGPHKKRFENYEIKTTWLNSVPLRQKLISPLRLLSPFAFKSLELAKYDVIIVSQTGAYFPNLVKKGKAKLICYTHTPPRYLYGYKTAREWRQNKLFYATASVANHFLRVVDFSASKNVDLFIANSEEVASRIEKFYRKRAEVIYPPVKIPNVVKGKKEDFYVAGGRLARAKGMDVIVKAFNKNEKKLKIFGKGFAGYEEELKNMAKGSIEFVGEVADEEKFSLLASAKAFIFASYDEDFGITPVEAMGVGTPVIAYRSGGVKETVIDGKTGIFYDENSPESLNKALDKYEKTKIDPNDCVQQAEKFSEKEFDRKIREIVNKV
jgi:glycosyltransferase involved in cell wall biosynthesis